MLYSHTKNGIPRRAQCEVAQQLRLMPCVLVVDRDGPARALSTAGLEERGCRTLSAGSGEEALRLLYERQPVDLVVTDVTLAKMSGLDFVRSIRQLAGSTELPVILCSSYIDQTTVRKAVEYKCNRFLLTPVHPAFLFEQVRTLLQDRVVFSRNVELRQA